MLDAVPREAIVPAEPIEVRRQDTRGDIGRLFETSYLDLVRLAAAILRDQSWAEDVVQDAFARVQTHWGRIREPDRTLAYLRTAVLNGARTELRRRKVRSAHPDQPRDPQSAPSADGAVLDRLRRSELLTAIGGLPNRQRNVVLLRLVQDLSIAETAATLRITTGAVKASQRRAVESLQKQLGGTI